MNDLIKLNVGGSLFMTTRTTLTKYPDSMLAKMFDPDLNMDAAKRDDTGAYFIDRCPKAFEVILQYLRTGRYYDSNNCNLEALVDDADYFGLEDLARAVCLNAKGIVWLNVGGKWFAHNNNDLYEDVKEEDMLKGMGRCVLWQDNLDDCFHPQDKYGAYVFDRDPELFYMIRAWITTRNYPSWINNHRELRDEASFYRIQPLVDIAQYYEDENEQ